MRLPTLIAKLRAYASAKVAIVAFAVVGFALVPTKCLADTTYVLLTNITPNFFLPSGAAKFSYTAPGFIIQDTFVSAGQLSACSTGYNAICGGIDFLPSSPGFGVPGHVVQIAFIDGVVNPNYYFPLTAFTVDGTYTTVDFQGANTGTLTATTTATTPEPSPVSLLGVSLAIFFLALGYRGSRRKSARGGSTF